LPTVPASSAPSTLGRELSLQILLGLVLGSVHLALSLELAISASPYRTLVRTLILLLYPLALSLTGLGALLLERWPRLGGDRALRGAGALLVVFLVTLLQVPSSGEGLRDLPVLGGAVLGTLGGWYLLLGAAMAASLHRLRQQERVSEGWAAHLLGLLLGYGLSEPLVVQVGANAVVLLTALALLLAARRAMPVWAMLLAMGLWVPLDGALEDLRDVEGLWPEAPEHLDGSGGQRAGGGITWTVWMGWSRRSQVRLVEARAFRGQRTELRVLYNFANQYAVDPRPHRWSRGSADVSWRTAVYGALGGAEDVLVIGSGAGRGLLSLPLELDERVHAVERNSGAVRLFTEVAPELNGHLYERVSVHAADGRNVLERRGGDWDGIVVESSLYHPAHLLLPASAPFFHQTHEALVGMAERLRSDGVLILEYHRTASTPHRRQMALRARGSLLEAGLDVSLLSIGAQKHLYVFGCRSEGCGPRLRATVEPSKSHAWIPPGPDPSPPPLTDDRPFLTWNLLGRSEQGLLIGLASLFVLGAMGFSRWVRVRRTRPEDWGHAVPFVLLVGVGHMVLQLHAFHLGRTFFEDAVRTVLVLIGLLLAWGALGSAGAARLSRWRPGVGLGVGVCGGLLALHWGLLAHLPAGQDSEWVRWLAAIVATAPGGLLMGALLPLGLRRASPAQLRDLVAVDAAGTLAGFALTWPVLLPFGARAFGVVGVGAYVVAAGLLFRGRGHSPL